MPFIQNAARIKADQLQKQARMGTARVGTARSGVSTPGATTPPAYNPSAKSLVGAPKAASAAVEALKIKNAGKPSTVAKAPTIDPTKAAAAYKASSAAVGVPVRRMLPRRAMPYRGRPGGILGGMNYARGY